MNRMELRKRQIMIISNIISFLTIFVLAYIIGDLGITYYAATMEVYMLTSLLFTGAIPDTVARFYRMRETKGQYKNAGMVLKAAIGYAVGTGLLGCVLLLTLSGLITGKLLLLPEARGVLRMFAFLFLLNAGCGVLLGYMQGIRLVVPVMIFTVLKELFGFLFAVLFGMKLHDYGIKVSALLHSGKYASLYGAEGAVTGLLLAMLFAMGFLAFVCILVCRRQKEKRTDGMRKSEDVFSLLKMLLFSMAPTALFSFLMRAQTLTGLFFFSRKNAGNPDRLGEYGIYYGRFFVIVGILVMMLMMVTGFIEGMVIQAYKKEEYKNTKDFLQKGVQALILFAVYFAGLFVAIAPSLFPVLFSSHTIAIQCMSHGFLIIILLPMGIYFSRILMGIGKKKRVLAGTFAAYILAVIGMFLLQKPLQNSVLVPVYGQLIFALVLCVGSGAMLFKLTHYNPEWIRIFALPALASAVMGAGIMLICKALSGVIGNLMASILAWIVGTFCYLVFLLVFHCIRKKDLYMLPGGSLLERIEKVLHIFG